ncbi:MAG: hypothetical protein E5W53_23565, partial [Mesorhizobium sp.]
FALYARCEGSPLLVRGCRTWGDRRRGRQAAGRSVPTGGARDGEGKAVAVGRLRGRRLSLSQQQPSGRLSVAGSVQPGRQARSRRFHLDHCQGRQGRAYPQTRSDARAPRLYRKGAGPSRWSTERSGEWEPVRPELVVEVRFDHVTGDRFRHGTKFLRWRPDKAPEQCTFEQIA